MVHLTNILYQNGHYGLVGYTLGNIFIWGTYTRHQQYLATGGRFFAVWQTPHPLPIGFARIGKDRGDDSRLGYLLTLTHN